MNTGISVKGLCKKYGNNIALNDINMTVMRGEIVGLVGTNGAGKSTLLSILAGLKKNYMGSVEIDGVSILTKRKKKNIGCLIENPGLYQNLTGMENIKYFSAFADSTSREETEVLIQVLELGGFIHKKVKKCSLGMKQRLGIAIALLGNPDYLLLDEPMRGVDPEIIPGLRKYLMSCAHDKNTGIVISSHILSEIESMCDRAVILQTGRVIDSINLCDEAMVSSTNYLISSPAIEQVASFLCMKNYSVKRMGAKVLVKITDADVNELIKLLISNGLSITGVEPYREKLEDRFIKAINKQEDEQ